MDHAGCCRHWWQCRTEQLTCVIPELHPAASTPVPHLPELLFTTATKSIQLNVSLPGCGPSLQVQLPGHQLELLHAELAAAAEEVSSLEDACLQLQVSHACNVQQWRTTADNLASRNVVLEQAVEGTKAELLEVKATADDLASRNVALEREVEGARAELLEVKARSTVFTAQADLWEERLRAAQEKEARMQADLDACAAREKKWGEEERKWRQACSDSARTVEDVKVDVAAMKVKAVAWRCLEAGLRAQLQRVAAERQKLEDLVSDRPASCSVDVVCHQGPGGRCEVGARDVLTESARLGATLLLLHCCHVCCIHAACSVVVNECLWVRC
jgi:hypothetical protein